MKNLLLLVIATLSLNAFSQSYVVMDNGITLTTDTSGFAYDFGHYAFPQKIILKGGQYFVEEGGILATIDENGLLYRKYELIPEKIKGKGINYFMSDEGFLYTVDKKGVVKVTESEMYKNTVNFGGNYFTVANADKTLVELYVVTGEGLVVKPEVPSLKMKDVVSFGGTYIMNNRGIVFTIATNGTVTPKDEVRVGVLSVQSGDPWAARAQRHSWPPPPHQRAHGEGANLHPGGARLPVGHCAKGQSAFALHDCHNRHHNG